MGTHIMKFNIARQRLIKEVQEEFNRTYPFLRIEFVKSNGLTRPAGPGLPLYGKPARTGQDPDNKDNLSTKEEGEDAGITAAAAKELLWNEFGLSDTMKVSELEILMQYHFGLPTQVLRKSGNLWMETNMTQHWTLRQQNDHGKELS